MEEVIGDWRQLFEEELYDLSSSKNIIPVIKKKKTENAMGATSDPHGEQTNTYKILGNRQIRIRFWCVRQTEGDHLEYVGMGRG